MVSIDLIFALVFYGCVLLFFFKTRKKWEVQSGILALYRTNVGLRFMEKLAKHDTKKTKRITGIVFFIIGTILIIIGLLSSYMIITGSGIILFILGILVAIPLRWLGYAGIIVGFIGMAFIFVVLLISTFKLFFIENAQPGIAPVLPGVRVTGLPTLSFWHWIISIFILAVVHEFSHGILARVHKVDVKSSGFGFLGPILLAFVEPDEKEISQSSKKAQLSIFGAGPFSNIILGALSILFFIFILGPVSNMILEYDGIAVSGFTSNYPAEKSGLTLPLVIKSINGIETLEFGSFINATKEITPDQKITLGTDKGVVEIKTVEDPKNSSRGFIGIEGLSQHTKTKENVSAFVGDFFKWFSLLVMWLFFINIGVGLFNLLPLGPVDGGRMFYVASLAIFKNEKRAKKAWMIAMYLVLFLIFVNLIPWLSKLVNFITGLFS